MKKYVAPQVEDIKLEALMQGAQILDIAAVSNPQSGVTAD